jgi:hypothetical protein
MDIVSGRQALGGHGIQYALLFSALHEGMLNFLVCLSSHYLASSQLTMHILTMMVYISL